MHSVFGTGFWTRRREVGGHEGLCAFNGRFLALPVATVLRSALIQIRLYACYTSRVDTPAPPLYTRLHTLCASFSAAHLSEIPMQRWTMSFFVLLPLVILVTPLAATAQPARKVPRIGFLSDTPGPYAEAFRQGLRERGYTLPLRIAGPRADTSGSPTSSRSWSSSGSMSWSRWGPNRAVLPSRRPARFPL